VGGGSSVPLDQEGLRMPGKPMLLFWPESSSYSKCKNNNNNSPSILRCVALFIPILLVGGYNMIVYFSSIHPYGSPFSSSTPDHPFSRNHCSSLQTYLLWGTIIFLCDVGFQMCFRIMDKDNTNTRSPRNNNNIRTPMRLIGEPEPEGVASPAGFTNFHFQYQNSHIQTHFSKKCGSVMMYNIFKWIAQIVSICSFSYSLYGWKLSSWTPGRSNTCNADIEGSVFVFSSVVVAFGSISASWNLGVKTKRMLNLLNRNGSSVENSSSNTTNSRSKPIIARGPNNNVLLPYRDDMVVIAEPRGGDESPPFHSTERSSSSSSEKEEEKE